MAPTNKLLVNFGKIDLEDEGGEEDEETDVKDTYNARVRFEWCG